MTDDTGTDWAALADKLDGFAMSMDPTNPQTHGLVTAAAVGLRRLAQLDTAIGDPEELRGWVDEYNGIMLRNFAAHILAAVLGSGERPAPPTTCPTCGNESVRPALLTGGRVRLCPDSWHGEQR